jgi:DNA uptake protein ComE-like DNA-binding protein
MALIFVITSITIGAGIHLFRSDSEELAPYPKEKSSFEMLQKEKSEVEKKLGKTSKSKSAKSKTKKLTSGEKINVNSAGVDELMQIPGIGEKTANDILAHIIQLGGIFKNFNKLFRVK